MYNFIIQTKTNEWDIFVRIINNKWYKISTIYTIIVDLGIRCEKYCKRSDTNSEKVGVLSSLEYCTAGKGSQPIRFENQNELGFLLLIVCKVANQYFPKVTVVEQLQNIRSSQRAIKKFQGEVPHRIWMTKTILSAKPTALMNPFCEIHLYKQIKPKLLKSNWLTEHQFHLVPFSRNSYRTRKKKRHKDASRTWEWMCSLFTRHKSL